MHTLFIILYIELAVLAVCFLIMLLIRLNRSIKDRRRDTSQGKLTEILVKTMEAHKTIDVAELEPRLREYLVLLPIVEKFERYFLDPQWQESKKILIDKLLLKKAKSLMTSRRYEKRQYGLRCIALDPKRLMDEELVVPLLNDPEYLVRIFAASCMIRAERKSLIFPVLKQMTRESPMARYPYRDHLLHTDGIIFQWIEEILVHEEDPAIIAICLDVLTTKISSNLKRYIIKFIDLPDLNIRLSIIKILANIPDASSQKYLAEFLKDDRPEVRAEAACKIGDMRAQDSIEALLPLLSDTQWLVRFQAALALKKMGTKGMSLLYQQGENNKEAHEIARYVLAIPTT